jgi:hypothetical protein
MAVHNVKSSRCPSALRVAHKPGLAGACMYFYAGLPSPEHGVTSLHGPHGFAMLYHSGAKY